MASLEFLKDALRQKAAMQPLSEAQYSIGFDMLRRGSGAYQEFIIPQLGRLLTPLFSSRSQISVLEIGSGPESVLEGLSRRMREKITYYSAYEPNSLFASNLEEGLLSASKKEAALPCLKSAATIHRAPFTLTSDKPHDHKFDVVLFCHSMYGMHPHHKYVEQALDLLDQDLEGPMVVVIHRQGTLDLGGLVCHRTASFPTGVVRVADEDHEIDQFASFITGFTMQGSDIDEVVRVERRKACRALGRREEHRPNEIVFSAPEVMMSFTRHAASLPELAALVPLANGDVSVKNREARLHRPSAIVQPKDIQHIQHCVRWAVKHGVGLTVLGGGHSVNCLAPGVVAIDMSSFDRVHILSAEENKQIKSSDFDHFVLVESGCKTEQIIRTTMAAGLTVPLGSRPSIGAGLWLQGGIGHLANLHGLACDAIVGAVLVSVDSGRILLVGHVPAAYRPARAVRLENEADEIDLLWAIKGAGTNFGVVISVVFKAFAARNYRIRHLTRPMRNLSESQNQLESVEQLCQISTQETHRDYSIDAHIYWEAGQLQIGMTIFDSFVSAPHLPTPHFKPNRIFESESEVSSRIVNGISLFEAEMHMSVMHSGHAGGKTSSFKRCLFLKEIGKEPISKILVEAIKTRPSPLCYIHLLQGGGAITDVAADATAFGCRDFSFACIVTGVWLREQDGTRVAQETVRWVYEVVRDLLPLSTGVYGADLGPDPRDAVLATKAFGGNLPRLERLKTKFDPYNVLRYACPLKAPIVMRVIVLVTGDDCAGKDYCADHWALTLNSKYGHPFTGFTARVISISDETKKAYASTTGANLDLLLHDRSYKEEHRPSLTAFFQEQLRESPQLREEHFLNVVHSAENVNLLFITGMRDDAPVANLSYLVPNSRLLDIRVEASEATRCLRRGEEGIMNNGSERSDFTASNYRPSLIFRNDMDGGEAATRFAERYLCPLFDNDLQILADMMPRILDHPRQGVDFCHVLDIPQKPGGLDLCTSLLRTHYTGDWDSVGAVVSCEAGGWVFAAPLAAKVNKPLALIREDGKLPPPTVSVAKSSSHISSSISDNSQQKRIEMGRDTVPKGAPVVVIDDVLATGETLCAVLELLIKTKIDLGDITVMVIVEFPYHRGRYLLRERGFGRVKVQSLLVYGGA
ncbi:phosphoribosyl transferase domain protein [Xylaria bambusicola]|uniref:phosphoribosyl transferase domain protein n=1 Tax=Xylaria bambusicola TaxID=326684 RepID=UPI00200721C9|nr:phosphoribosyl transferase domain protein [Xylaria bambusicola]KAI0528301.1 phosphoribosyl transferase domain protein [Xylaria bambusicola]